MSSDHPALRGIKATVAGIIVNVILAILKLIAGITGHSFAMVADAIESVSDVFSSIVVWIGLRTAAQPPDEDHPYGHGKAEPLAAVVVSIALLGAAIFITIQSIKNIMTPHELPKSFTLVVLVVVIVVKEVLFRRIASIGQEIKSTAVKGDAQHHRSDAITSLAALIGIGIAIYLGKGYESADDWAALLAAVVIVWNAWKIFKPAFSELMDEALPLEVVEEVRKIAMSVDGVMDIDQCFVRKMGFEYFVDIHVVVDGNHTVRRGHEIGHMVKDEIMRQKPNVYDVLTHVEPG